MIEFIKTKTPIQICDIGASSKDNTKFLEELFINTNSTLIGFEPNNDQFEKLEKNNPRKKYYNFGIGDGKEKTLNICDKGKFYTRQECIEKIGELLEEFEELEEDEDVEIYLNEFSEIFPLDEPKDASIIQKNKEIVTNNIDDLLEIPAFLRRQAN